MWATFRHKIAEAKRVTDLGYSGYYLQPRVELVDETQKLGVKGASRRGVSRVFAFARLDGCDYHVEIFHGQIQETDLVLHVDGVIGR